MNIENNIRNNKRVKKQCINVLKGDDSLINYYLNKDIVFYKNKNKLNSINFSIPLFNEYNKILEINYTLNQLIEIKKYYKLKSGNKELLKKNIYNFLFYSNNALKIQKNMHKFFIKKYIYFHGPGFYNKNLCVNKEDFCTLDNINNIPYTNFISFKDANDFIYGFDIVSLYNLYLKNKTLVTNPYNNEKLEKYIFENIINFIKYSKLLKINLNINYEERIEENENKKIEIKFLTLFQNIDYLGNYTNVNWILMLNKHKLIKFIKELLDIWLYRANISQETKRNICPPYGNPFKILNINIYNLEKYNFYVLRKNIANLIDEFINKGINNDNKTLGSYYILSALTLVSSEAAESLPWLYESVI